MPAIQQLPPSVVNKIAAGEVIERPASVVKELVENSLDAGATRIDVSVEQGGLEAIRVVDNGCGIAPGELNLAVASHATSKLRTADDLFRVQTLGFRGEALASIAEVSRVGLRSRTAHAQAGAELEVVAGQASPVSPCGCATGTTIEVRNLFFNTPVRRKFLRSVQTEMGHVTEALTRLALAHPQVHFSLRHNQRSLYELPPCDAPLARIAHFFGRELADALLWLESRDGDVRLSGYVGHPSQSRPNNRMQYLFLNGRSIRDRSLGHALAEAYRGLLLTGRCPVSFLSLELPPELVDVNVHPTKLEVRFQDGGRLYSQLLGTLRTKFLTTDLTHRLDAAAAEGRDQSGAHDAERAAQLRSELVDWAKGQMADWQDPAGAADQPTPVAAHQTRFEVPLPTAAATPLRLTPLMGGAPGANGGHASHKSSSVEHAAPAANVSRAAGALQIHNRYLVAETADGVAVIDQHALHERILYEQLRERVLAGALEAQHLLVPEPVDLCATDAAAVLEERELLATLGIKAEPFGGDTVLISSYPAMLAGSNPVEILRTLIERLTSGGRPPDRRDLLDELLHALACRAAIKAGDPLSPQEVAALIEQRHLAQDSHHCPHGRPTELVFTREDLDRQFKRT
ncbi:MAG TPA: DNA mismatch repair endonuclease MutL [Pirellulales bacterium]|nr:DNA mismatch repair endonuclease MutL [Pirellulales bacterium]